MNGSYNQQTRPSELNRIGVVGMGLMGSPMACTLMRAGYQVGVFNRTIDRCKIAETAGAKIFPTVAQLAAESEVLILMLADDAAVDAVITGCDGVIDGGKDGLIVLNCSTVHPRTNQRLARALSERNITLLDAPVTGSRPQAEAGQLYFLVGGDEATYRRCIPLLEAMGRGHIHLGPVGAGACAKLGNNLMAFINLSGTIEALEIAARFGLAPQKFLEVISNSGGRSAMSELKGPKILRADWSSDFALRLAAKDLRLARSLAEELRQPCPVLAQTAETFAQAATEFGDDDVCSLIRWYREQCENQPTGCSTT